MNRRELLKSLLLGTAVASAPNLANARASKKLLVQKTMINGMAYYDSAQIISQLSFDDPVTLKRELQNLHDAKAVEVYWGNSKLGYVPRISNFALAKMLDEGEKVTAVISDIDASRLPYSGIEIEITWEGK